MLISTLLTNQCNAVTYCWFSFLNTLKITITREMSLFTCMYEMKHDKQNTNHHTYIMFNYSLLYSSIYSYIIHNSMHIMYYITIVVVRTAHQCLHGVHETSCTWSWCSQNANQTEKNNFKHYRNRSTSWWNPENTHFFDLCEYLLTFSTNNMLIYSIWIYQIRQII